MYRLPLRTQWPFGLGLAVKLDTWYLDPFPEKLTQRSGPLSVPPVETLAEPEEFLAMFECIGKALDHGFRFS